MTRVIIMRMIMFAVTVIVFVTGLVAMILRMLVLLSLVASFGVVIMVRMVVGGMCFVVEKCHELSRFLKYSGIPAITTTCSRRGILLSGKGRKRVLRHSTKPPSGTAADAKVYQFRTQNTWRSGRRPSAVDLCDKMSPTPISNKRTRRPQDTR